MELNAAEKMMYVDIESNTQTISLSHVNFSYDEKPVINDFSYSFSKGKKYALSGENGSGKTTLGKVLSGLLSGYEGSIRYDDQELKNISKRSL